MLSRRNLERHVTAYCSYEQNVYWGRIEIFSVRRDTIFSGRNGGQLWDTESHFGEVNKNTNLISTP